MTVPPISTQLTTGVVRLTAVGAAILLVTILIVTRSQAVFTATTSNSSSSFSTGTVTLTDDDSGSALFSASSMSPGSPTVACIEVTYSGTELPAPVRLYGSTTGALAPYLNTTIEVGTGGDFSGCAGFTPSSTLFSGTLDGFATTHTDWSSGLAVFTAAANPTVRTLRFTIDVQNNPAAQGQSSTADFTFETQA